MRYGLMATEAITELDPTLNVVKYLEAEARQSQTGEYDQLYQELEDDREADKVLEVEAPSSSDTNSSDSGSDESSEASDSDDASTDEDPESTDEDGVDEEDEEPTDDEKKSDKKDDTNEPAEEDKDEPSEAEVAVREAFRTEYYDRRVAETFLHGIEYTELALKALSLLRDAAAWVGFQVVPYVAKKVAGGTLWIFAKAVMLGSKMTVAAGERLRRIKSSIPRRISEVKSLRKSIASVREQQAEDVEPGEAQAAATLPQPMIHDEKLVKWFTVGNKTDPVLAGSVLQAFTDQALRNMSKGMLKDLDDLEKIIELTGRGTQTNVLSFMRIAPFDASFLKRPVKGYSDSPDLLDTYVYQHSLPNSVLFIANLPRADLRDIETTSDAYKASGILLGIDARAAVPSEEIPVLSLDQAEKFLDVLEQISLQMIEQARFYVQIEKNADRLKLGYRHYYQKLVGSKERQTLQETLAEYVYLKQAFVAKAYLPAAMDIHDYVAAFISAGLRYVKLSVKQHAR